MGWFEVGLALVWGWLGGGLGLVCGWFWWGGGGGVLCRLRVVYGVVWDLHGGGEKGCLGIVWVWFRVVCSGLGWV